jgi:hypothetical protein
MTVFTASRPLIWGELDVPLLGLNRDLRHTPLQPSAGFSLVLDPAHLWFIASHRQPALPHPLARPGKFQSELWQHDVAELFLTSPDGSRYFEFNLAPNGAWWTCEFTAPRVRAEAVEIAMPGIATFAEMGADGAWLAAMAIPAEVLRARLDFGAGSRANVTMILESPRQRFFSATPLPGETPDFHQPAAFPEIAFMPLPD